MTWREYHEAIKHGTESLRINLTNSAKPASAIRRLAKKSWLIA